MKLKFTLLSILFTLIIFHSFGQIFEGQITYQNSYKSKIPNIPDQQLTSMMGATMEYFIKGGNYRTTTNGTLLQWQVYINKDNKVYTKMTNTSMVLWNDGAVNTDEIIKVELNKGVLTILNQLCDELILTCKSGVQRYYFNQDLKADAKQFAQHKFGNWNEVISRSNALPLKMIIESPQFILESVATAITPAKLEDAQFILPADSKLEKSPY